MTLHRTLRGSLVATFAFAASGCSFDTGSLNFVPDDQVHGTPAPGTGGAAGSAGSAQGGTGATAGMGHGGATACSTCTATSCTAEVAACASETACAMCLGDLKPSCAGNLRYDKLIKCACNGCQADCNLPDPVCNAGMAGMGGGGTGGAGTGGTSGAGTGGATGGAGTGGGGESGAGTGGGGTSAMGGNAGMGGGVVMGGMGGATTGGAAGVSGMGGSTTGGGGTGTGGMGGPPTYVMCTDCALALCGTQVAACGADAMCSTTCVSGDPSQNGCDQNQPWLALAQCVATSACAELCNLVTPACGNGALDQGEQCDPGLPPVSCKDALGDPTALGNAGCSIYCRYDVTSCVSTTPFCGDGKINQTTEACDASNLGGTTCATILGNPNAMGNLACTSECGFNARDCHVCGNGKIEGAEQCDSNVFPAGQSDCASFLHDPNATGQLVCDTTTCKVNTSMCVTQCNAPLMKCGTNGQCVDISSDPSNCGACGNFCPNGQQCSNGACICQFDGQCANGNRCCNQECVDVSSDPNNCGACGLPCVGGQCQGGQCICPQGQAPCKGECIDMQNDPNNCGGCGIVCGANPPGVGGCANAQCNVTFGAGSVELAMITGIPGPWIAFWPDGMAVIGAVQAPAAENVVVDPNTGAVSTTPFSREGGAHPTLDFTKMLSFDRNPHIQAYGKGGQVAWSDNAIFNNPPPTWSGFPVDSFSGFLFVENPSGGWCSMHTGNPGFLSCSQMGGNGAGGLALGLTQNYLYATDITNALLTFSRNTLAQIAPVYMNGAPIGAAVAADEGLVYATQYGSPSYGILTRFSAASQGVGWQNSTGVGGAYMGPPVITGPTTIKTGPAAGTTTNGVVVIGVNNGNGSYEIRGISVEAGTLLWTTAVQDPPVDLLVASDNFVYAAVNGGNAPSAGIIGIDPATGSIVRIYDGLSMTFVAEMVLDKGMFWLTGGDPNGNAILEVLKAEPFGFSMASPWPIRMHDAQRTSFTGMPLNQ